MEVTCDNQTDRIALVGPGFHGWIYQSKTRPLCYRLLHIDASPLEWRNDVKQCIARPMPVTIAPITKAWQQEGAKIYFCIRYEVAGLRRTLIDALADPDPLLRTKYAARVSRAMPGWWEALYSPLMIMPADVVFAGDGQPRLLAAPAMDAPAIDLIFEEPARSLYLAPEVARGRGDADSKNADRYALGVMLLQCFYKMPPFDDPGSILVRSLTGELFSLSSMESALPFWMEDIPATRQAITAVSRMIATDPEARSSIEPEKVAALLETCLRRMDAQVVAVELRDLGQPFEAYSLIQNVMLTQETFDLLLLAGEIAGRLSRPLEAVDFFERAIAKEPDRSEAYVSQFTIFASASGLAPLEDLIRNSSSAASQVDARIRRDFEKMPDAKQEEHEADMACYLVWRNQIDPAIGFIRSRLYDGEIYMWWKFDLNLVYVQALVAQGKLEEAQQRIIDIKIGLAKARQNQTVAENEIHRYGAAVAEIEADIFRMRSTPGAQV